MQTLPYDLSAEHWVIWSIILDSECYKQININYKDFYWEKEWSIFKCIQNLVSKWITVDFITLCWECKKIWIEEYEIMEYSVPTSANIKSYAKIVKEMSNLRNIIRFWDNLMWKWYKYQDYEQILLELRQWTLNLNKWILNIKVDNWQDLKQIMHDELERKIEFEKSWKSLILKSNLWLTFERWSHTVIWALPSHWKSAFMLNILIEFAQKWYKVLYVNIEMVKKQVIDRVYAYLTWVDSTVFKYMDALNIKELIQQWESKFSKFSDNFKMLTKGSISSNDIYSVIANEVLENGVDIHWVDYIWILKEDWNSKVEQMTRASNWLREIAKEFNTIWITAAQFSKEWYKANKPSFVHIKDSSAIFDDADCALVLFREKDERWYDWEVTHKIIIEKNRTWNIWTISYNFKPQILKFNKI